MTELVAHDHERVTSGSVLYPAHTGKVPNAEGVIYQLPAHGQEFDSCGVVRFKTECENQDWYSLQRNHCDRAECPVCYGTWATRRARVAAEKLEAGFNQMRGSHRPRHIVVSPPSSTWHKPYNELLQMSLRLIKENTVGRCGGVYVGHPWRFVDSRGASLRWKHCSLNREAVEPISEGFAVYSPHVHFQMFGWIAPSEEIYRRTGWTVKMIAQLPNEVDVFSCVRYQLTHCGISKSHHAIRWFGNMSYNNFVKVSESKETIYPRCPLCDGELWMFTLEGKPLGRYSLEVTKYHYRFKPKQKRLVPKKRVQKRGSLVDFRSKGRTHAERNLREAFFSQPSRTTCRIETSFDR